MISLAGQGFSASRPYEHGVFPMNQDAFPRVSHGFNCGSSRCNVVQGKWTECHPLVDTELQSGWEENCFQAHRGASRSPGWKRVKRKLPMVLPDSWGIPTCCISFPARIPPAIHGKSSGFVTWVDHYQLAFSYNTIIVHWCLIIPKILSWT